MTNSHNRSGKNGGSHAERYFNNHSPQQVSGGGGKRNNNATNGNRGQKSPSSTYFRSISTSNAIPIVQSSTSPVSSKGGSYSSTSTPNGRNHSFNLSTSYQRTSPGGGFNAMLAGSPPNFSHFAGSKCYDAPAPTALPKPPVHWTSSASSSSSSSSTSTPTQVSAPNTSKTSTISKPATTTTTVKNASSTKGSSSSRSSKAKSVQKPAMSCAAAAAKANRHVDFAHNLKMILNVQA